MPDFYDDRTTADFTVGQRVATHPATDAWMMGDRFGVVVRTTKTFVSVALDSGRSARMHPANLAPVEGICSDCGWVGRAISAHATKFRGEAICVVCAASGAMADDMGRL